MKHYYNTIIMLAAFALLGCKTKVVTVPEVHEHWHHTTDTIERIDSVTDWKTTVVREVDSATMARFGVELQGMQRAWLVETDRMQRELSRLRESRTDTVVERDSIPVPYPVDKLVEKELTKWQRWRLHMGDVLMVVLGAGLVFGGLKLRKRLWG